MKKIYLLLFSFIFLTGCAQNLALLGPAFSVVKTGGVQHALVGETINYGVKNKTGKKVSEHALSLLEEDVENQECNDTNSNSLRSIFFNKSVDQSCKKIQ
tara:strand:- start:187 stop:486 length:300 start_codon:yes stop_codon:yes gene_type:complete